MHAFVKFYIALLWTSFGYLLSEQKLFEYTIDTKINQTEFNTAISIFPTLYGE